MQIQLWIENELYSGEWVNEEYLRNYSGVQTSLEARMTKAELHYFQCALKEMQEPLSLHTNSSKSIENLLKCHASTTAFDRMPVYHDWNSNLRAPFAGPLGAYYCESLTAKEISDVGFWRFSDDWDDSDLGLPRIKHIQRDGKNSVQRILAALSPPGSPHDSVCFVGDSLMEEFYDSFRYEAFRSNIYVSESVSVRIYGENDPHPHPWSSCLFSYFTSNVSSNNVKFFNEYIYFEDDLDLILRTGSCGILIANIGSHYVNNCQVKNKRGCSRFTGNAAIEPSSFEEDAEMLVNWLRNFTRQRDENVAIIFQNSPAHTNDKDAYQSFNHVAGQNSLLNKTLHYTPGCL